MLTRLVTGQLSCKISIISAWVENSGQASGQARKLLDTHFEMIRLPAFLQDNCPGELRRLCTIVL
jgi:hypothetical protein